MQAVAFDAPGQTSVPADAQSSPSCCGDNVRPLRVGADLVHVTLDIYGRLPGFAGIYRVCDATHVHICEECSVIARCGD
jgi:hypothetical protein